MESFLINLNYLLSDEPNRVNCHKLYEYLVRSYANITSKSIGLPTVQVLKDLSTTRPS